MNNLNPICWASTLTFCVSLVAFARNDGFSRDFGGRSSGGASDSRSISRSYTPDSVAPRNVTAPSAERSFSRPEVSGRSAPVTPYTPRAAPAPAPTVQAAPPVRSAGPAYSGRSQTITPSQPPTATPTPRITSDNSARFQPTPSGRDVSVDRAPATHPVTVPRAQSPTRYSVAEPERPQPTVQTGTPRLTAPNENARSFGTPRSSPAAPETPVAARPAPVRTAPERVSEGLSRTDLRAPGAEAVRRTDTVRTVAPPPRETTAGHTPALRSTGRNTSGSRDPENGGPLASRTSRSDIRVNPATSSRSAAPMRFGTSGVRGPSVRGEASELPSSLSLRSSRGDAATDRFGRASVPRTASGSPERNSLVRAPIPSSARISGSGRPGNDNALYRPPFGTSSQHHQPSPLYGSSHGNRSSHYNNYHHDDHHDSHHDGHHDNHHGYHHPYGYGPYACSPVWWGPVVYPAGFGLTWYHDSFALSIATYAPAYSYPRYYDSWHCGGWGYTGVYYGGWRSGWYGGFSYVYNPWPVYRTYYLYDPPPVETVYVTEPAATTVYVTQPATTTVVTAPAAASASYAAPAVYASSPASTVPASATPPEYSTPWEAAPAVAQTETVATACFCPCRCNGQRPCTCDYPCGSEYALRDEEFDLSRSFSSYASTLSAELIWSSYAGLDRWETASDALESDSVATWAGDSL